MYNKIATVKLNNQGDMMMFYDYNDDNIEEDQYREEWKGKYLSFQPVVLYSL